MANVKKIVLCMLVIVFVFTVVGCNSKTVAVVNGKKISQSDLDKVMAKKKLALEQQGASFTDAQGQSMLKALEQQTVQELIEQTLILQAAKKEGLVPSKSEITKQVEDIKSRFGGAEAFDKALKQYGYTMKEIEEKVSFDTSYTKLFDKVTADVKVTEEDIKKFYTDNASQFKDPVQIKARAILVKFDSPEQQSAMGQPAPKVNRTEQEALKLAEELIAKLDDGAEFSTLAEQKSEDDRFKTDGGLIKDSSGKSQYAQGSVMPTEFDAAAIALKPGHYNTKPIKTALGLYVIKLESLTPEKQLNFEEAKSRIVEQLPMVRKQEMFNQYFTDLQSKAKITNNYAEKNPSPSGQVPEMPPSQPGN